jgi:hypothetical protein
VRGILSSARIKRRLVWTGAFMVVAGGVAALIVAFPRPAKEKGVGMTTIPGDVVKQDKPRRFSPSKNEVLTVARKFIWTAVKRQNVADSWELVAPSLKEGYTKKSWAKGDIPVVPFPVDHGRWRLAYSYENEIDVKVALWAPPEKKLRPVVFDLTFERVKTKNGPHWLVSGFLPTPSASGDFGSSSRAARNNPLGIGTRKPITGGTHTSGIWLFVPAGILGLALLVLAALGIKGWRGKRMYRAHVRERQMSSSRTP